MTTRFVELEYVQDPHVMESEVRAALYDLQDRKAPDGDDIPVELIKDAGDEVITIITRLCRRIWETNQWPEDWRNSVFLPIPKKGDARECGSSGR